VDFVKGTSHDAREGYPESTNSGVCLSLSINLGNGGREHGIDVFEQLL
jgi:hypothetical protein